MKIFMIECTEDELRANRGIMDAIIDACQGVVDTVFGTTTACQTEQEDDPPEARVI